MLEWLENLVAIKKMIPHAELPANLHRWAKLPTYNEDYFLLDTENVVKDDEV